MKTKFYNSYRLSKLKKITLIKKKIRKLRKNEILIKVIHTGICGSDISTFLGHHPYKKPPIVCGHETIGKVVDFGSLVKNLKLNDIVTVMPYNPCLKCVKCKNKDFNFCNNKTVPGYKNWDGAFSEYFIAKKESTFKVNNKINLLDAVLLEPMAISNHAMDLIKIKKKNLSTLIIGAGCIGLTSLINLKKNKNIGKIGCVDKYRHKKIITKKLGANYFIQNVNVDLKKKMTYFTKSNGVDLIFLCTSYNGCLDEAVNLINEKGQIIILSYFEKKSMQININKLLSKEIIVNGSYLSKLNNFKKSMDLILKKKTFPSRMISHILPMSKTEDAFKMMISKKKIKNKIILSNYE